jgi:Holliday junction resolvase
MVGRELVELLEKEGFSVVRRSQSYVWLGRGKAVLLIDTNGEIAADVAQEILDRARNDTA